LFSRSFIWICDRSASFYVFFVLVSRTRCDDKKKMVFSWPFLSREGWVATIATTMPCLVGLYILVVVLAWYRLNWRSLHTKPALGGLPLSRRTRRALPNSADSSLRFTFDKARRPPTAEWTCWGQTPHTTLWMLFVLLVYFEFYDNSLFLQGLSVRVGTKGGFCTIRSEYSAFKRIIARKIRSEQ
jgi:hypothetical protein